MRQEDPVNLLEEETAELLMTICVSGWRGLRKNF